MEVHHHSHAERRKWTHYFWEFFMLFLAVTLGFLVENQREHFVEHQREKTYIGSLVEDIQLDMQQLNRNLAFRAEVIARIDSLFVIFKQDDWKMHTALIYFLSRRTTRTNDLFYHDRTMQQLKNSGGLRLIRNIQISNRIATYDAQIRRLLQQHEVEIGVRAKLREKIADVFDPIVLYDMSPSTNDTTYFILPKGNPPLRRPEQVSQLLGELYYLKNIYEVTRSQQKELVNEGTGLITQLKENYSIK
ncbi:MAG TPA: hypothetical protein VFH08_13505 [Chitinophagaceae bacterium]|nr:hypothetical protein [Chitinophagaceae bacterium]